MYFTKAIPIDHIEYISTNLGGKRTAINFIINKIVKVLLISKIT